MVDQVVRHMIVAALPNHDRRRGPVNFPGVMHQVVDHLVVVIRVFSAGTITGQQNGHRTDVGELIADDAILLARQI